jgi:hypothetical protein
MRDLTKSMLTFPWAISMFAVQQVADLTEPASEGRVSRTAASLDAVTQATEQQLDGWAKQTYQFGNSVQRGLVDLMMLRPPAIDSSSMMRMVAEMQSSPLFQAGMKYGMPPVGWLDSLRVARADAPAALQEFANKLYIIQLVTQVHSQMGLDAGGDGSEASLTALVDLAGNMETFPRLWAVEGIGNYCGDHAMEHAGTGADPQGLLTDPSMALPPWTLTMLHAGIGMSFAKAVLAGLDPASPSDAVQAAIKRFVALCRASSQPGYAGAALESLGLATRTLYQNLVPVIDRELPAAAPDIRGYFWHGAGRAMYFTPANMLPSSNAPWSMIAALDKETSDDLSYRNALSGIAWALTVVNMRNPSVMEAFLRHHGTLAAENDAFANGMTSSLMMRYDTTRDDAHIDPFIHYEPKDAAAVSSWRTLVSVPCDRALYHTYGELQRAGALQELFHYRPSPA